MAILDSINTVPCEVGLYVKGQEPDYDRVYWFLGETYTVEIGYNHEGLDKPKCFLIGAFDDGGEEIPLAKYKKTEILAICRKRITNDGKIVVFDIDGTIANMGDRLKYLKQSPKDYESFYNSCFDDEPILEMCNLLKLFKTSEYQIVFLTGRRDSVRDETYKWIKKYTGIRPSKRNLIMRPGYDHRKDNVVKIEMFKKYYEIDDVYMVFEDRDVMVKTWRDLGVRCLQVADGDY